MPTILDLLGITMENRKLDGMSLLPLLKGSDMTSRTVAMPFWRDNGFARQTKNFDSDYTTEDLIGMKEFSCPNVKTARTENFSGWAAWTEGRWKLHKHENSKYELYDIVADPAETKDLASQKPDVVKDLAAKLSQWQCSAEVSLTGADNNIKHVLHLP